MTIHTMIKKTFHLSLLTLLLTLTACVIKPPQIYDWENYQKNVNAYYRGDKISIDDQVRSMEEDLLKIKAKGAIIPPGYQAHLGLLYAKQGNIDGFVAQLDAEKKQYPESQPYIDFLLRNLKK